jgi:excisionase family DNA binding protein
MNSIQTNHAGKLLYSLVEASQLASISLGMMRKLARKGQLEVVRIGRSVRVPKRELLRLCGVSNEAEAEQ